MSKTTRQGRPEAAAPDVDLSETESIPSTLDPTLDPETTEELEREIGDIAPENHEPPEDEIPEEAIFEEVRRAAEELPADTPVDRADQTDKRMENPPSGSDL
ncbi:hypothetical protein [Cupriavidus pauculus]|uniref:hypothetical protein n=1 Tax=Cupriavidus pauculus TaxID=82633 RepID=UPI001562D1EE|nr:hypothetical protein [Cupriavidus pauculus]